MVKTLQALADAPPLEEDCATRDLSRMRGKNGDDFDLLEPFERRRPCDTALVHPLECAANGAGLRREFRRKLRGAATALALIGLGEVGQLEIDGKRFRHAIGFDDSHALDRLCGALHQLARPRAVLIRLRVAHAFAVLNRQQPEFFDRLEKRWPGLLFQDLAEQPTERAHIAAQGRFFNVRLIARQLIEPSRLVVCPPQGFYFRHLPALLL